MLATVLAALTAPREQQLYGSDPATLARRPLREKLMWVAARISINRVVAGIHFPVDLAAGMVLGVQLGKYFELLGTGETTPLASWTFDGEPYGGKDFRWGDLLTVIEGGTDNAFLKQGNSFKPGSINPDSAFGESPLRWLWGRRPRSGGNVLSQGRRTMGRRWNFFTSDPEKTPNDLEKTPNCVRPETHWWQEQIKQGRRIFCGSRCSCRRSARNSFAMRLPGRIGVTLAR